MRDLTLFEADTYAEQAGSIIDSLCALLIEQLAYGPGERDLVVLSHEFVSVWPDGSRVRHAADLIELGERDGDTAMARTVGIPCALAADMILSGAIARKGVLRPIHADIYEPLLIALEQEGIVFQEREIPLE
jgi:saccharopine dehydrogenase-like NADP-dependent oxidoreductase